jgi:hypothetical protein
MRGKLFYIPHDGKRDEKGESGGRDKDFYKRTT